MVEILVFLFNLKYLCKKTLMKYFLKLAVLVIFCNNLNSQSLAINDVYQIINTTDEFVVKDMKEFPISYNFPYPANSIFAVGYFTGTISVPSLIYNSNYSITSQGGKDGFVMQILYNEVVPKNTMPAVTQILIYQIGGLGDDEVNSIDEIFSKSTLNSTPELTICGSFENSCTFYNNTNSNYGFPSNNFSNIILNSSGQKDIFYANLLGETLFCGGPFYSAQSIGGPGNDVALSISRKDNKISLIGYYENQINITGNSPYCNKTINSNGLKDIVLVILDRATYAGSQIAQNPNENVWIYGFGGQLNDIGTSLMFSNSNNINDNLMVSGHFESPSSNFNLPNQSISLSNGGANDIFFGELPINSPNLIPCHSLDRWSYLYRLGSSGNDISTKIFNQENYIILSGAFEGTVNFRPTIGSPHNLTSSGSTDGFVATYRRTIQWSYNAGSFTPSNILLVPDCYRIGGSGEDIVNDVISDYFDQNRLSGTNPLINRFAICGKFESVATLSKSIGNQILGMNSNGGSDYFYISFSNPTNIKPLSNITCYYSNGGINDEVNNAISIGENDFIKIFPSFSSTHSINSSTVSNVGLLDGLFLGFNCCKGYSNIRNFSGTSMDICVNSVSEKTDAMDQYLVGNYNGTPNLSLFGGGLFNTTSIGIDGIVLKLDSLNQLIWVTNISGTSDQYINSICELGNYIYVGGNFTGSITLNGNTYNSCGTTDCFIACIDKSNGTIQWFKHIGGSGDDGLTSIAVSASNIVAVGTFGSSVFYSNPCSSGLTINNSSGTSGFSDIFMVGLSLSGSVSFLKSIGNSNYDEQPTKIIYNSFGNCYYLTGLYQGTTSFGTNPGAATLTSLNTLTTSGFLSKFDILGNNIFAKSIDVLGGIAISKDIFEYNNELFCVFDITGQNISFSGSSLTLPGHTSSNIGGSNIIVKYNLSGTVLNATQICEGLNTVLTDYLEINSIFIKNGEIYLTGVIAGQIQFNNITSIYSNYGAGDLFSLKLNSNLELECGSVIGGNSSDNGTTIINNYYKDQTYIVGNLNGNLTYGINSLNLLSPTNLLYEILILKFDCCRN